MGLTKYKLGDLIELCDDRNADLKYGIEDVKGVSIQKTFIETKANMKGVSLRPYILVQPDSFVYVTVTSRNGNKITLAHNTSQDTYIVSSSYVVFKVSKKNLLSSDYLFMYFNRPEFDRYSRFNSWGSARETFSWENFCDIEINLPPLSVQEKYVNIYSAMIANQQSYEQGFKRLDFLLEALVENCKKCKNTITLGEVFEEVNDINTDGLLKDIYGINIQKQFMRSNVNVSSKSIKKYKKVREGQFIFSGMQTGRDECIRIAYQREKNSIIVSPAYTVLKNKNTNIVSEYLMLWLSRKEIDRLGWFMSDGSIRTNLDLDRLFEIKVPLPDLEVQKSIAAIYSAYNTRKKISTQLKEQIKNICPVLIKGSIEEGRHCNV